MFDRDILDLVLTIATGMFYLENVRKTGMVAVPVTDGITTAVIAKDEEMIADEVSTMTITVADVTDEKKAVTVALVITTILDDVKTSTLSEDVEMVNIGVIKLILV